MPLRTDRLADIRYALDEAVVGNVNIAPDLRDELIAESNLPLPGQKRFQHGERLRAQRYLLTFIVGQCFGRALKHGRAQPDSVFCLRAHYASAPKKVVPSD